MSGHGAEWCWLVAMAVVVKVIESGGIVRTRSFQTSSCEPAYTVLGSLALVDGLVAHIR